MVDFPAYANEYMISNFPGSIVIEFYYKDPKVKSEDAERILIKAIAIDKFLAGLMLAGIQKHMKQPPDQSPPSNPRLG